MQVQAIKRYQTLREIYEAEFGQSISVRTWQRVKNRLRLEDEDTHRIDDVKMAARLQASNPRKSINLIVVRRALHIERTFPTDITAQGSALYLSICNVLGYEVPPQTVYRWGKEIGIPFSVKRWYTSDHLKIWAKKVLPAADIN